MADNYSYDIQELTQLIERLQSAKEAFASTSREADILSNNIRLLQTELNRAQAGSPNMTGAQLGAYSQGIQTGSPERVSNDYGRQRLVESYQTLVKAEMQKMFDALDVANQQIMQQMKALPAGQRVLALPAGNVSAIPLNSGANAYPQAIPLEPATKQLLLPATTGGGVGTYSYRYDNTNYNPVINELYGKQSEGVQSAPTQMPPIPPVDPFEGMSTTEVNRAKAAAMKLQMQNNFGNSLPPGSEASVLNLLEKNGFKREDIQSVTKNEPTGISKIQAAVQDDSGVWQKMEVSVDKYGQTVASVSRRQQDFGTAVGKDTIEFLKWSVAMSLIMVPLQAINTLTQDAIQNQSKLVDITVVLGQAQSAQNAIFESATEIADKVGVATQDVLTAYTLAYRATGNIADSTERATVTNKLLTDSLTLAKLAGISDSEAIDQLAGALRQTFSGDSALSQGTVLLDKWVETSRVANVSLETLASAFSMLGDTADAAKISTDDLNAIIATVSESTGATSASNTANSVKALISGIESNRAVTELQKLGVAITDTTGDARGFVDIMNDVASLKSNNLISPEQFQNLTLALGGGVRRQSVWTTLIDNWNRVGQISAESANAQGEAASALDQHLATVETASTRLGNAFQELAQNFGTKGGVLDGMTQLMNVATALTGAFNSLTGAAGRSSIPLLGTLAAVALIGGKNSFWQQSQLLNISTSIGKGIDKVTGFAQPASMQANYGSGTDEYSPDWGTQSSSWGTKASNWMLSPSAMNPEKSNLGYALGYAPMVLSAVSNLSDSTSTMGEKTARVGADIAGGIIGGLITGGNPIGVAVGTSISEAFVNGVLAAKPQFSDLFAYQKPTVGAVGFVESARGVATGIDTLTPDQKDQLVMTTMNDYLNNKTDLVSKINKVSSIGGMVTGPLLGLPALAGGLLTQNGGNNNIGLWAQQSLLSAQGWFQGKNNKVTTADIQRAAVAFNKPVNQVTLDDLQRLGTGTTNYTTTDKSAISLLGQIDALSSPSSSTTGYAGTYFAGLVSKTQLDFGGTITNIQKALSDELMKQLQAGKITPSTYKTEVGQAGTLNIQTAQAYTAFGQQYGQKYGESSGQVLGELGYIQTLGSSEEIAQITQLGNAIADSSNKLSTLTKGSKDYNDELANYNDLTQQATLYTHNLITEMAQKITMMPTVDLTSISPANMAQVYQGATADQLQYAKAQRAAGVFSSDKEMNDWIASQPQWMPQTTTGYGSPISGLGSQFVQQYISQATKDKTLTPISDSTAFQTFDMTQSQFQTYMGKNDSVYNSTLAKLEKAGYTADYSTLVPVFKDGIEQATNKDWKVVQYLLSEILNTENKALESSIYNLPSDMNFFVPFQGYNTGISGSTANLDTASSSILSLANAADAAANALLGTGKQSFGNLLKQSAYGPSTSQAIIPGLGVLSGASLAMGGSQVPDLSTKLSLNINNNTSVVLDGKILGEAISQYLGDQVIKYSGGLAGVARLNIL